MKNSFIRICATFLVASVGSTVMAASTSNFIRNRRMGQPITACGNNLIAGTVKEVTFTVTSEQGCAVNQTYNDMEQFQNADILTDLELAYYPTAADKIGYTVEIVYSVPGYQAANKTNTDGTNPPTVYIGGCDGYICAYCTGLYADATTGLVMVPGTNGSEWKEVISADAQNLGPTESYDCTDENGNMILPCTFNREYYIVSNISSYEEAWNTDPYTTIGTYTVSYNDTIFDSDEYPTPCDTSDDSSKNMTVT
eukprot:CFRG3377T1